MNISDMTPKQRAYQLGIETAKACFPNSKGVVNPYSRPTLAKQWKLGWSEGWVLQAAEEGK